MKKAKQTRIISAGLRERTGKHWRLWVLLLLKVLAQEERGGGKLGEVGTPL